MTLGEQLAMAKAAAAAPTSPSLASWYTQGDSDSVGDRLLMFDSGSTASLELLRFKPALASALGFEQALRARVAELQSFSHPSFPVVRAVERLEGSNDLTLVSTFIPGKRLADVFRIPRAGLHPALASWLIRELTPALADLQRHGHAVAHGALTPERIVLTDDGKLAIVEHVLGPAIERLRLSPHQLWYELGIFGRPAPYGASKLDSRADIVQLGLLALSVLLGRRVTATEYPAQLDILLDEVARTTAVRLPTLTVPLARWLEHALRDDSASYGSAIEAREGLKEFARLGAGRARSVADPFISGESQLAWRPPVAEDPEWETMRNPFGPAPSEPVITTSTAPAQFHTTEDEQSLESFNPETPSPAARHASPAAPVAAAPIPSPPAVTAATPASLSNLAPVTPPTPTPATPAVTVAPAIPAVAVTPVIPVAAPAMPVKTVAVTSAAPPVAVTVPAPKPPVQFSRRTPQLRPVPEPAPPVPASPGALPERRWLGPLAAGLGVFAGLEALAIVALLLTHSSAAPASERSVAPSTPVAPSAAAGVASRRRAAVPVPTADAAPPAGEPDEPVKQEPLAADPAPRSSVPPAGVQRPATVSATDALALAAGRQRSGGLRISSAIDIQVIEGDRVLGSSATGPIVTAAGRHELEFINPAFGYRARQQVDIKAGQINNLTVTPPQGSVSVNVLPWAQVWIDGSLVGDTPLANLPVAVGEHLIVFRHPQLGERTEKFIVKSGALTRVSATLGQ